MSFPRGGTFAGLLLGTLLLAGPTGCGEARAPGADTELRTVLDLAPEARVHRVEVTVTGDRLRMLPRRVRARTGDVVRFVVLDHRDYLIRFEAGEMDAEPAAFLRSTGQDRPPPLLGRDAFRPLDLREAPDGRYPFRIESSGLSTSGEILVESH